METKRGAVTTEWASAGEMRYIEYLSKIYVYLIKQYTKHILLNGTKEEIVEEIRKAHIVGQLEWCLLFVHLDVVQYPVEFWLLVVEFKFKCNQMECVNSYVT